jgi:hypothetical protein
MRPAALSRLRAPKGLEETRGQSTRAPPSPAGDTFFRTRRPDSIKTPRAFTRVAHVRARVWHLKEKNSLWLMTSL